MRNLLSEVHPELVCEWSEKNLPLTPDKITFGSNKIMWWKGSCGHEWQASVKSPVSYTHLDVYKRQPPLQPLFFRQALCIYKNLWAIGCKSHIYAPLLLLLRMKAG